MHTLPMCRSPTDGYKMKRRSLGFVKIREKRREKTKFFRINAYEMGRLEAGVQGGFHFFFGYTHLATPLWCPTDWRRRCREGLATSELKRSRVVRKWSHFTLRSTIFNYFTYEIYPSENCNPVDLHLADAMISVTTKMDSVTRDENRPLQIIKFVNWIFNITQWSRLEERVRVG